MVALGLLWLATAYGAPPPPIVQCSAVVTGEDTEVTVRGWGPDTRSAKASAVRSARVLAEQRLLLQAVLGGLGNSRTARLRMMEWVRATNPKDALAVPGFAVTEGRCRIVIDRPPKRGTWTATWRTGEAVGVRRREPTAAIEAARRRACLVPYQREVQDLLAAFAAAREGTGAYPLSQGWAAAIEQLDACFANEPMFERDPGDRPPKLPPGPFVCEVDGVLAWGRSPSITAQVALTEAIHRDVRQMLSAALTADRIAEATRTAHVFAALEPVGHLVADSDRADLARVACFGAGQDETMRWVDPTAPPECPDDVAEPVGTGEPGAAREALCARQAYGAAGDVVTATALATPDVVEQLALTGWGVVMACEASCRGATRGNAPVLERVPLIGQPDLSSEAALGVAWSTAVADRDAAMLAELAPDLRAPMLGALADDPEAFWARVAERADASGWPAGLVAEERGGRWVMRIATPE